LTPLLTPVSLGGRVAVVVPRGSLQVRNAFAISRTDKIEIVLAVSFLVIVWRELGQKVLTRRGVIRNRIVVREGSR
jgi:hypothetical protein